MGIRGLETFIDQIYASPESRERVFKETSLKELNLLIDGNQIAYLYQKIYPNGNYGGQYDVMYEKLRCLFVKLKPFIGVVMFNETLDNLNKLLRRLEYNIKGFSTTSELVEGQQQFNNTGRPLIGCLASYQNTSSNSSSSSSNSGVKARGHNKRHTQETLNEYEGFNGLKKIPPTFSKLILIEVLNDLKIKFLFSHGPYSDKACLIHANGCNESSTFYTALSKDSYFYVYKIRKGYISIKFIKDLLLNPNKLSENTKVPVFLIDNLIDYLSLKSFKTWLYFCIMLGDNDFELDRNFNYLNANGISTKILSNKNQHRGRQNDTTTASNKDTTLPSSSDVPRRLIDHLREHEDKLIRCDFIQISSTYMPQMFTKLRELMDEFEFNSRIYLSYFDTQSKSSNLINLDREISSIRANKYRISKFYIENYKYDSISMCLKYFGLNKYLYLKIFEKETEPSDGRQITINEFRRKSTCIASHSTSPSSLSTSTSSSSYASSSSSSSLSASMLSAWSNAALLIEREEINIDLDDQKHSVSDEARKLASLLHKRNEIVSTEENAMRDNLTLFFSSLCIWYKWIEKQATFGSFKQTINANVFINSLLINLALLAIRKSLGNLHQTISSPIHEFSLSSIINDLSSMLCNSSSNASDKQQLSEIVELYDTLNEEFLQSNRRSIENELINKENHGNMFRLNDEDRKELASFIRDDLTLVHRLNEFQLIYQNVIMINRVSGHTNLDYLSPSCFLNGWFFCKYINCVSCQPDTAQQSNDADWLTNKLSSLDLDRKQNNEKLKELINKISMPSNELVRKLNERLLNLFNQTLKEMDLN